MPKKSKIRGKAHPRRSFTQKEDDALIQLVNQYGTENWKKISTMMNDRNPRQCKERWINYLSPSIKNDPFSESEDALLRQKYEEFGPKWVKIAKFFDNRTDISIKCRWAVLKRRAMKKSTRNRKYSKSLPASPCDKDKEVNTMQNAGEKHNKAEPVNKKDIEPVNTNNLLDDLTLFVGWDDYFESWNN